LGGNLITEIVYVQAYRVGANLITEIGYVQAYRVHWFNCWRNKVVYLISKRN